MQRIAPILLLLLLSCATLAASRRQFFLQPENVAASFQLTNLSDLVLWIDVSQATNAEYANAPTNGSQITKIQRDLSPANHTILAPRGTNIIYHASGGGHDGTRPYVTLTNDNLLYTNEALTNTRNFTIGMVWQYVGPGDNGPIWSEFPGVAGTTGFIINAKGASGSIDNLSNTNAYNINVDFATDLESPAGSWAGTNWNVLFIVSSNVASKIWLNGTEIVSGTLTYGNNALTNGPLGNSGWGGTVGPGVNWCSINFARGLVWGRPLTSNELWQASRKCMDDFGFP